MSDQKQAQVSRRRVNPPIDMYGGKASIVAVGTTPTKILEENPRRVGIIFTTSGIGTTFVWPEPRSTDPRGIPILSTGVEFRLTFNDFPTLVTGPWYAVETTTGTNVAIWEELALP